ncbi:unnamed protein product [Schistosoma curassoni]|uniref:Uncharacterized protein n=1 Tax=Schistosoma curassoni TaxID=6186 RepID=A0A183K0G7_9TREM|nr:unnamed protein product [Schistosoma curassoni]
MVGGSSQQETLDLGFVLFGTRQQGVSVILRGLMLPDGFDPVSPSSTFKDITSELGQNKPDRSEGRNQEKALQVDSIYIEEGTQLYHKASSHLESSWSKEKRKTKEHITSRNGDRYEKNEQELNGTRKEGPGQSGLENAGRRRMLHCE